MNLPEPPAAFRQPTPAERPWWWRLEAVDGSEVDLAGSEVSDLAGERFSSQSDAESWIGEVWSELRAAGVAAVTLVELDREVYGPMSLDPGV